MLNRTIGRSHPCATARPGRAFGGATNPGLPNGNVTTETDVLNDAGNTTLVARYTYDNRDRRLTDEDPLSGAQRSSFDPVGNRTSLIDSANNIQPFSYDAKNRGTSAGLGTGQLATSFDKSDLRTNQRASDGTESSFVYDAAKRITLIDHSRASASVARVSYRYDFNSNRIEQKETNGAADETTTYQFDQSDRLTRINYPDKRVDYTLDAIGNRTVETERNLLGAITKTTTGTFNARNQLIQLEVRDQSNALIRSTTFSYDANGNQTTEQTVGQPPITTVYDVENRVLTLTTQGAPPTNYRYHPNGLRIEKSNASEARRYRFDQGKLIEERNVQNALLKRYFRSSAGTWIGQLDAGSQPITQTALLDVSASPMALISSAGIVTSRIQLDAWGQVRNQSGVDPGIQFQGYLKDAESPNLFAFARRYSSATGTFLSADPVPGDERLSVAQNLYLGFHGNPTIYLDPDGRTEQLRQLVNNFGELHESSYQRMDGLKAEFGRTQNPLNKYLIGTAIGREFALNLGLMVGEGVTLGADVISDAGMYALSEYAGLETGTEYSKNAIADLSDSIGKVGYAVSNDPLAVASSVHSGYVETVSRAAFDNDSKSQTQILPDVFDALRRPLKALDDAVARSVVGKTEQDVLMESGDGIGGNVPSESPTSAVGESVVINVAGDGTAVISVGPHVMGPYSRVRGHHPHQQAARSNNAENYNPEQAITIADDGSFNHAEISKQQIKLNAEARRSGAEYTLEVEEEIQRKAMLAGGISEENISAILELSRRSLKSQGALQPTRTPGTRRGQ